MAAHRCSICAIDWPVFQITVKNPPHQPKGDAKFDFKTCPLCGHDTWHCTSCEAVLEKDARAAIARARFELYYTAWDSRRTDENPDAVGRREGAELAELQRYLKEGAAIPDYPPDDAPAGMPREAS